MRKGIMALRLLLWVILSFGGVSLGMGQGMWGTVLPEGRSHAGRMLALLDSDQFKTDLGLTNSQVERLRQIIVDAEKADVKVLANIGICGIELRESLRADKPDRDKILKQVQELSALRGEILGHHVEAILAAKQVLSPEQQRKAFSLFENLLQGWPAKGRRGSVDTTPPAKADVPEPIPIHPGEPPVE